MTTRILIGDCREMLRTLPDDSVHCVVTSPPYFGLRDYGVVGQIGLEPDPDAFVEQMVAVFSEVWRALMPDGTVWLNLGDSYASGGRGGGAANSKQQTNAGALLGPKKAPDGFKSKDLLGIPWRVAFALQADGWYLRQDIIWSKPNPMPESVRDRCTKAHEYLFLLSKSERYHYDADAIKEDAAAADLGDFDGGPQRLPDGSNANGGSNFRKTKIPGGWDRGSGAHGTIHRNGRTSAEYQDVEIKLSRNKRSVWTVPTSPFPDAHFATFPPALIEPCILAGCPKGGTVLDPFGGAGTTGLVADRLQRSAILIELNPEYAAMAERRIRGDAPLFHEAAE